MPPRKNHHLIPHARAMRRAPTRAEARLWRWLRSRRHDGHKFRRQVPIGPFIVDFYCPELRLVIEMDGRHHGSPAMNDYDSDRTALLISMGIRVFRINNDDLRDVDIVAQQIDWMIEQCTPPHPPSAPSPPRGGGEGREGRR